MIRSRTLVLAVALALACGRDDRRSEPSTSTAAADIALDPGALRASAIDGLEAAAADPTLARALGLATALEHPDVEVTIERMLARLDGDPQLAAAADRLFAEVQDSPAMRAALADYARANPDLDLAAVTEGFVGHVDARLTRAAIAEAIEEVLRTELRGADPALARALLVEADGAEALATAIVASLADARIRGELERRLGRDPAALQARLERRLGDPGRVGELLEPLGRAARTEAGLAAIINLLDHVGTARLVAAALARALDDPEVRSRARTLFGLALAEELDRRAFERELRALLDEPAIVREAATLLAAIAREPFVREQVASVVATTVAAPEFGAELLDALD